MTEAEEVDAMVEEVIALMDGGASLCSALLTVLEADDERQRQRWLQA